MHALVLASKNSPALQRRAIVVVADVVVREVSVVDVFVAEVFVTKVCVAVVTIVVVTGGVCGTNGNALSLM